MRTTRVLSAVLASLLLVFVVAACGGGEEATPPSEPAATEEPAVTEEPAATEEASGEPVVIGFVGAQTGWMSIYDQHVLTGARIAADEANAAGGVLGGRPIEFIECDSKTEQPQAAVCAEEVIADGADFVMPSCDFDMGAPAARVANDQGVTAIGCAGGLEYGAQGVGPLLFNTYSGSATEGAIMAEWAYEEMGWRNPYILTDVFIEYTKDVSDFFEQRWIELAGEDSIAGKDTFDNTDESVAAQVSRLRQAVGNADFIVVASLPPGGPGALRQIRGAGIDLPILGAAAFDGAYWLEAIPDLSDFYYPALGSLFGDDPDPARAKLLYEDYPVLAGEPPVLASYPLLGYAAVQSLITGMEAAGSTDGEAVATAISAFTDEPLITGPTTYTSDCHIPSARPYLMMQIQGGANSYTGTTWTPASVPPHPC